MFNNLSQKFSQTFARLKGKGSLTPEIIDDISGDIRTALLEADVALPVVKEFVTQIKAAAVGQSLTKTISPEQLLTKIVHDELVKVLGDTNQDLILAPAKPSVILMVGLQGSGKTTSTGKLGLWLQQQKKKRVLLASLDVYRPAAREQLAVLGQDNNLDVFENNSDDPVKRAEDALAHAKAEKYDVILLDSAGRLEIDESLMAELDIVKAKTKPSEIMFVADALMGQSAASVAKTFHDRLGITGITLTRIDGDGRGGAALSIKTVTGQPIKFLGVGERINQLDIFYPDRIAGRILDQGDVVSLVEQAQAMSDEAEEEKLMRKIQKGRFNFNDLGKQLRKMEKMGGLQSLLGFLPGMGKLKDIKDKVDDSLLKRQLAIIDSMTRIERLNPQIIAGSRRKRIAGGAGVSINEVNKLIKMHKQMTQAMKKLSKMDPKALMRSGLGGPDQMMK
jgi:signal recognition particle subunit SRP54